MNEFFGYRYNPSYTPEPHFIPGYGGYLPRVLTRYGITYGSLSHEVLREEPAVAKRLVSLGPCGNKRKADFVPLNYQCKKDLDCWNKGNILRREETPIPDYVYPGYMGCLTFEKKGLSHNACCNDVLEALGYQQDPYEISKEVRKDPFSGTLQNVDFSQANRRCKNGVWMQCELYGETSQNRK